MRENGSAMVYLVYSGIDAMVGIDMAAKAHDKRNFKKDRSD